MAGPPEGKCLFHEPSWGGPGHIWDLGLSGPLCWRSGPQADLRGREGSARPIPDPGQCAEGRGRPEPLGFC